MSTPLQRLLSHPFIKKAGVASTLYPNIDRKQAGKNLAWRDNLKPEEVERMQQDLRELKEIIDEFLV